MKFVDEIEIVVRAGHGGAGCVSFLREKFREHGGPDGGDGGRGGDVYLRAHPSLLTLGHFMQAHEYNAGNGEPGRSTRQTGAKGDDLELNVPFGTEILDADTETLIEDMNRPDARICVARGGKGGLGNHHFATSVNQAPEHAQGGLPGDERRLLFRLKLIADVGLLGLPNTGKSTLLDAVSRSHPRIADYAFTTLTPNIGVVERADGERRLLLADIPGIIEGASRGHGLGLSFLRHIERVGLIVYMIDGARLDAVDEIRLLRSELASYSEGLLQRPAVIVINKMDQFEYDEALARESVVSLKESSLWPERGGNCPPVFFISAAERRGTAEFVESLFDFFPEPTFAELSLPETKIHTPGYESEAGEERR